LEEENKIKKLPLFIQCLQEFPESSGGIYKQKRSTKKEKITVKRGIIVTPWSHRRKKAGGYL